MAAATRQTIPAVVRGSFDVDGGDRVEFVEVTPGRYEIIAAARSAMDLKGMFGAARKSLSIEEMNAVIAQRAAKRFARVIGLDTNVLVRHARNQAVQSGGKWFARVA